MALDVVEIDEQFLIGHEGRPPVVRARTRSGVLTANAAPPMQVG